MHALTSVLLLWSVGNGPASEKPVAPEETAKVSVAYGYVQDGYVFAAARISTDQGLTFDVYRGRMSVKNGTERTGKGYRYFYVGRPAPMFQWRISHGHFWGINSPVRVRGASLKRIALDELEFFDPINLKGDKEYAKRHPKDEAWYVDPVKEVAIDYQRRTRDRKLEIGFLPDENMKYDTIHFDMLPTDKETALLFILDGDSMRVWEGVAKKTKGNEREEWDLKWTEVEEQQFTTDMREPFIVYAKGGDYYFLTQSGKLYLSRKPPEKDKRKTESLWTDPKSPIRAVIADTESGKTFAFTGPVKEGEKDGKTVFFEMGATQATKAYELKHLEEVYVGKPLQIVLEYTQVLVDEKKLKLPEK